MKTISKKKLFLAIAGVTAIGTAGVASAVEQSQTGLGQVLVFPMYTVKTPASGGAFNTYLSIVNSTGSTKAVKVRFREGKASKEVLDFNVFLSPYDVWVAGVSPTPSGGAIIGTPDHTCTKGTLFGNPQEFR